MKKTLKFVSMLMLASVTTLALTAGGKKAPVFYMAGDSTMADGKDAIKSPARGWGQMFHECFDGIRVENWASPGQSSKSFRQPRKDRWAPIMQNLQPGDFVFIQFGHNDPKPDSVRHTTPEIFAANLERFIHETQEKGGIPILLTPIERRVFDRDGVTLRHTHTGYIEKYAEVSQKTGVPVIDLNTLTRKMILSCPPEESKKFFKWVEPGTWEMFAKGNRDNTHLNILGARVVAAMAAREFIKLHPEMTSRLKDLEKMGSEDPAFSKVAEIVTQIYAE